MRETTYSTQVYTLFGGGYVPEQHAERAHWNLVSPDVDRVVKSLKVSMFDEVMKSLRSALSLG
jgi:hypothetical protein